MEIRSYFGKGGKVKTKAVSGGKFIAGFKGLGVISIISYIYSFEEKSESMASSNSKVAQKESI